MSWKLIEPLEDGTPVVYVGVHAVKWRREWGIPSVGFIENDASELAQVKAENKRLREALKEIENKSKGLVYKDTAIEFIYTIATNALTDQNRDVDNTESKE
jgi:hypothetical protein